MSQDDDFESRFDIALEALHATSAKATRAAVAAERSRIRRELRDAIDGLRAVAAKLGAENFNAGATAAGDSILIALDRICPEAPGEAEAAASPWQPIETAPVGVEVLLWFPMERTMHQGEASWVYPQRASHWMPLPAGPVNRKEP